MVAEHRRSRVGPLARVDDAADGVESPPSEHSVKPAAPIFASCVTAATPTQPSARPITAESTFGASTQNSFSRIAVAAPV